MTGALFSETHCYGWKVVPRRLSPPERLIISLAEFAARSAQVLRKEIFFVFKSRKKKEKLKRFFFFWENAKTWNDFS